MQQQQSKPKSAIKIVGIIIGVVLLVGIVIYLINKNKGTSPAALVGDQSDSKGTKADDTTDPIRNDDLYKPIGPYPDRCIAASSPLRKGKGTYVNNTSPEVQKIVHQFFDKLQISYSKTGVAFGFMKGIDVEINARNLMDLKDEFVKYMNVGKAYTEEMVTQGEFLCESGNNLRLVPFFT